VSITLDLLDELHAAVALDLLNADALIPVYAGSVPDSSTRPYILVYPTVAWPNGRPGDSMDGKTRTCETRWYVHCVGETDQSARSVAGRVRQLLLNVRPTISGRSCGLIKQEASPPPVRDETTGVLVLDIAAVYLLVTEG
jgi:hypothetical protein